MPCAAAQAASGSNPPDSKKQPSHTRRLFLLVREGGLEPPRPEWTLEPESAEVFDLCYGFCFLLRCCRFWQPRLDFLNTALDCGIFAIYILIIASDFGEGKEFFFKNRQVRSNFIETGKELYSSLLPALKQQLGWRERLYALMVILLATGCLSALYTLYTHQSLYYRQGFSHHQATINRQRVERLHQQIEFWHRYQ